MENVTPDGKDRDRIASIHIDEGSIAQGNPDIAHEREVAIFDIIDGNSFALDGVDRILVELHDHVTGLSGVGTLFRTLAAKGFVYDPRHSAGSVILFQRLGTRDIIRPYAG